jgi:hypothetical protein
MTQEHIVECKTVDDANRHIATGNYRLLEHSEYRGYILVRRSKAPTEVTP